jgi:hypothetical protein
VSVAVRPEHGPTLPEILPARHRRAAGAALLLVVLVIAGLSLRASTDGVSVVRTEPLAFNFHHADALTQVDPRGGEILRLEREVNGKFNQAFAILPLSLPAYRGDVGGTLPLVADGEIKSLKERYAQFELVEEGKARINDVAGYQVVFRARLGERRLYGRLVLLPETFDGEPARPRRGVRLLVEATPSAGVGKAEDAGVRGLTKRPFRSFRFGTEAP